MSGFSKVSALSKTLIGGDLHNSSLRDDVVEHDYKQADDRSQRLTGLMTELGVLAQRLSAMLDKPSHRTREMPPQPNFLRTMKEAPVGRRVSVMLDTDKSVQNGYSQGVRALKDDGPIILGAPDTVGIKPGDIFSDFTQGAKGDCVVIAAIKAAMMKFGHNPHGIYKKIETTPDGFNIVMRDDFTLHITQAELRHAMGKAGFEAHAPSDVLTHAKFLFAVSAKRIQLERYYDNDEETFNDSIAALNTGDYPGEALRRLGLSARVVAATMKDLRNGAIGTLATGGHVGLVVDGYLDHYGKVKLTDTNRGIAGNIGLKLV